MSDRDWLIKQIARAQTVDQMLTVMRHEDWRSRLTSYGAEDMRAARGVLREAWSKLLRLAAPSLAPRVRHDTGGDMIERWQ